MAKIIQIIDVNSEGHQVRLDDGFLHTIAHGGQSPQVGDELVELAAPVSDDAPDFPYDDPASDPRTSGSGLLASTPFINGCFEGGELGRGPAPENTPNPV